MRRTSMVMAALFLSPTTIAKAGDSAKGALIFHQYCAICHSDVRDGPANFGPNLFGVVGRKPGRIPTFDYSVAMRAQSLPWSPVRLRAYIDSPQDTVPGARMRFVGPETVEARDDLVAYLATLR